MFLLHVFVCFLFSFILQWFTIFHFLLLLIVFGCHGVVEEVRGSEEVNESKSLYFFVAIMPIKILYPVIKAFIGAK